MVWVDRSERAIEVREAFFFNGKRRLGRAKNFDGAAGRVQNCLSTYCMDEERLNE